MSLPFAWKTNDFLFVRDRFGLTIQLTHEDADKLRHTLSMMVGQNERDAEPVPSRHRAIAGVAGW